MFSEVLNLDISHLNFDEQEEQQFLQGLQERLSRRPGFMPSINLTGGFARGEKTFDLDRLGVHKAGKENFNVGGRLGFDANTSGGYGYGAGASGHYYRGHQKMPDVLQNFGEPERYKWNSRGVQLDELDAYLNTPGGSRFELRANPNRGQRGISGRITMPF